MLHGILDRITKGEGREEDTELLRQISHTLIDTSLCQLGGSAPNPVLSTLRYFADEYEAHIGEKRCPAGVCRALVGYAINDKCIGDAQCAKVCPTDSISGGPKHLQVIDQETCIQCDACYQICRFDAVSRVRRGEAAAVQTAARERWKPVRERQAAGAAH